MFKFILIKSNETHSLLLAKTSVRLSTIDLVSFCDKVFDSELIAAGRMTIEDGIWETSGDGYPFDVDSSFCRTQEGFNVLKELRERNKYYCFKPYNNDSDVYLFTESNQFTLFCRHYPTRLSFKEDLLIEDLL